MHRFHLSLADLASASFACSPLHEAVLSIRMWTHPGIYPAQMPWFRRIRPDFERLDTELLRSLVSSNRYVPDFLTPRPTSPSPDFRAELAVVRACAPERLRAELEQTFLPHDRALPAPLAAGLADPARLLAEICDSIEEYWDVCLAPAWWPRARSVLEADIVHRARTLAQHGVATMFAELDPRLQWADGVLTIRRNWTAWDEDVRVDRRGLVFVPSCFARGAVTSISADQPPAITYPARGQGTMAGALDPPPTTRALELLLGAPKARLLAMLHEPVSTTELALRLGVTAGAVSQHLTVLLETRLVTRARHGRSVLYLRSPLGNELLR
ncbi:DNA-binding transcriptional ArsR family regulator [Kitasatospora sp. MAA4]|uniref:ArsR/SmtB family transcription factor n=1 Tax=Kitasatospora sp. MAA4 TaxID=3035093 RepID=UPI0024731102|nr:winged helix-turn-helix domain-containing protein [Kitasatospora sp. MAA4]MDH6136432.1 DNA-binding transcriptional ArsR family regulator [Kitasatospora sp. MAA4]